MIEHFELILKTYLKEKRYLLRDNNLSKVIRQTIPRVLNDAINNHNRYKIKGSSGAGRWAEIPWVAIMDKRVASSVQSGIFPVYLFKRDMSGFYLSLTQGFTSLETEYKSDIIPVLKNRARSFRPKIPHPLHNFNLTKISLGNDDYRNSHRLVDQYEAANIIAKYYALDNLPNDSNLLQDLKELLKIYDDLMP